MLPEPQQRMLSIYYEELPLYCIGSYDGAEALPYNFDGVAPSAAVRPMLPMDDMLASAEEDTGQTCKDGSRQRIRSYRMPNYPYLSKAQAEQYFPPGELDEDGQQVDLRPLNSWYLSLDGVRVQEHASCREVSGFAGPHRGAVANACSERFGPVRHHGALVSVSEAHWS